MVIEEKKKEKDMQKTKQNVMLVVFFHHLRYKDKLKAYGFLKCHKSQLNLSHEIHCCMNV
jgi:hypothetical protein